MRDGELFAAWMGGDVEAGQSLIKRHYRRLYHFFYGKVDEVSAADLTQRTFEILCSKRDAFRGDSSFRSFLLGIARWTLVNYLRRHSRNQRFEPLEDSIIDPGLDRSMTSLLAGKQQEQLVAQALHSLPLDDQIALELKEYEGLTLREIGAVLDIPTNTAGTRLHRARKRLRKALERLGYDLGADPSGLDDPSKSTSKSKAAGTTSSGTTSSGTTSSGTTSPGTKTPGSKALKGRQSTDLSLL